MGFPAGVGRDFAALERRRTRAASLLAKGLSQSEVARRVGAHRQSVSKWAAGVEAKGRAGLKQAGRAGRKPRLSAGQISQVEQGLKRGPQALGYETSLWTANRVAHLIERETGGGYHPAMCGGPCGTPAGVAPPRGAGRQSPGLQYPFYWKTLAAMAGVTWWNFYFRLFPGSIKSPQVVEFLRHLMRHLPDKLLIIWDGLPSHHSHLVWDFVRQQRGRLWLAFLPAHAPEPNPVEYLWSHWEQHELPHFCPS